MKVVPLGPRLNAMTLRMNRMIGAGYDAVELLEPVELESPIVPNTTPPRMIRSTPRHAPPQS